VTSGSVGLFCTSFPLFLRSGILSTSLIDIFLLFCCNNWIEERNFLDLRQKDEQESIGIKFSTDDRLSE
jgi:hypothetical protein